MNGRIGPGVVWIVGTLICFRVGEPHGMDGSIVPFQPVHEEDLDHIAYFGADRWSL